MFDLMDDMDTVFLESGFEEPVSVLSSKADTEYWRTVDAVVFRNQVSAMSLNVKSIGNKQIPTYDTELIISRTDLPVALVNETRFRFKKFPGDFENTVFKVAGILKADEGAYRLGLTA